MPLSRRRKKKGKVVKNNPGKRTERLEEADISVGVSLQDLINVVAYQEYVKDGTIVPPNVKVEFADNIPVNIVNEDGSKTQIGTAERDPFNPDQVCMDITDPEMIEKLRDPLSHFSVSDIRGEQDGR